MAEYTTKMNDFLTALVNVVAFQEVLTKAYENPIAEFKKGAIPLGYTGEFAHVNPAMLEDYTRPKAPNFTNPFTAKDPVVFADYLTVNNDKIASALLSEDYLNDAFTSYEKVYEMGQQIESSLYSGNAIFERDLMLSTALTGFGAGVRTPVTMTLPTDEASAQQAILAIKDASSNMENPSSAYVSAAFSTAVSFVEASNQVVLIKNSLKNRMEVYAKSVAFNVGNLEFAPRMIGVNEIGQIGGQDVLAIVMDVAALQIRDKVFRVDSIFNPADGTLNYWLRRRTMAGFVGFANAVAFVAPAARSK